MAKEKPKRKHLVKEVEFLIGKRKSLVISLSSNIGLDRIIVENESGVIRVKAEGHSRFEFSDKKLEPGTCDFWLSNPSMAIGLKDYLEGRFWSQFNWGELFRYRRNTKLKKMLRAEIQKMIREFESKASKRLNNIIRKAKK